MKVFIKNNWLFIAIVVIVLLLCADYFWWNKLFKSSQKREFINFAKK